jgi:hypothetical protein
MILQQMDANGDTSAELSRQNCGQDRNLGGLASNVMMIPLG